MSTTISDPYSIRSGDTMSSISTRSGKSVAELMRLNHLSDPNAIQAGKTLYLSEQTVNKVTVLFIDMFRHPIKNIRYVIKYDGKEVSGTTGENGMAQPITTNGANSIVEVWVKGIDNRLEMLTSRQSGVGHKRLTCYSHSFITRGQTDTHSPEAPLHQPQPSSHRVTPAATGTPSRNNTAVREQRGRTVDGLSVIHVGLTIPPNLIALFESYTGEEITENDWIQAAASLSCEVNVLKAFAQVETKGDAFWQLNTHNGKIIPTILYERHYFSRLTHNVHDEHYHDISSRYPYGKDTHGHHSMAPEDRYGHHSKSYFRLLNAYALNHEAALRSCSWGKFQIMGDAYDLCRSGDVDTFIKKMCTSEKVQLDLFANFIRYKAGGRLLHAVQQKDWYRMALYYNGPATVNANVSQSQRYDYKLQTAYERLNQHRG